MNGEFADIDFRDYLRVLKKRKILFMFFIIVGIIAGLVRGVMLPHSYSTSAVLNLHGLKDTVYANPTVAINALNNKEVLKKILSDLKLKHPLEEINVSTEVLNITQQDGTTTIPVGVKTSINSRFKDKLDVILNALVKQFLQKNKESIENQRTALKNKLESTTKLLDEYKNTIENKRKIIDELIASPNYQPIDKAILSSLYSESIITQQNAYTSLLGEQSKLISEISNLDESKIFIPATEVLEAERGNLLLNVIIIAFLGLVLGLVVVFLVEFLSTVN